MAVALFISLAINVLCVIVLVILLHHNQQYDKSIAPSHAWRRWWSLLTLFKSPSAQKISNDFMSGVYQRRTSGFAVLPTQSNAIVFLGDSLIQACEWAELTGLANIQNRGIAGDTVERVMERVDSITQSHPSHIVLMVGINDLRHENCNIDQVLASYEQLLNKITHDSPQTEILIHSVLPINPVMFKNRFRKESNHINHHVAQFNQKLNGIITDHRFKLIDLRPLMAEDDGHLSPSYTVDGLHLSGAAYTAWAQHLLPLYSTWMPESAHETRHLTPHQNWGVRRPLTTNVESC